MRKLGRRKVIFLTFALAISLLLSAILDAVQAGDVSNEQSSSQTVSSDDNSLTDFQLKLSEHLSKGNTSELTRIRNYMTHHNELNKDINPENPPSHSVTTKQSERQTDSENTRYLTNILGYSESTIDPYTLQTIGFIDHPEYAVGDGPDGYSTHLQATGWYDQIGGEAIAWGAMSDACDGQNEVHVVGKRAQQDYSCPPWYNYLIIAVSTNGYNWDYPLYCEVQSSDFFDITIGSTDIPFNYLAIYSWCPWGYNPPEKSSFYIDSVEVIVEPITYTLTVDVYESDQADGHPIDTPTIYIDGGDAGVGYLCIQLAGSHTIAVDDQIWSEYWNSYVYFSYFTDGLGNGDTRNINGDMYITAWYSPA